MSGSLPSGSGGYDNGGTNQGWRDSSGNTPKIQVIRKTYSRQTLVVQRDYLRAEDLERLSREARERNILIMEIRRA